MRKQPAKQEPADLQTRDHATKMAQVRTIKHKLRTVCVLTRVLKEQQKYQQKTIKAFLNVRIFGSKDLQRDFKQK